MAANKKDETKDTKDTKAAKDEKAAPAVPVRVSNHNARSDEDAYEGAAVKVVAGEHEGAKGIFQSVEDYADDGYPENIVVQFTDPVHSLGLAVVPYADVRPANYVEPDPEAEEHAAEEAEARTIQPDQPVEQVGDDEPKSESSSSKSGSSKSS